MPVLPRFAITPARTRRALVLSALGAAIVLSGCQAQLETDLAVSPAGPTITAVSLAIPDVDFEDSDAAVHSFDTERSDAFDVLQHYSDDDAGNDADTFKLFSDNSAKGDYVAVRAQFDVSNASVTTRDGTQYPLSLVAQPDDQHYALNVGKNDKANLILTLELSFSLIDDTSGSGGYQLQPVIRVARSDTEGTISGTIATSVVQASACRAGRSAGVGVAAYLYDGSGVTPTDYFRSDTLVNVKQPIAAAFVQYSATTDAYAFEIDHIVPGTYTIAWTCQADNENPIADDQLVFNNSADATVGTSATSTVTFTE